MRKEVDYIIAHEGRDKGKVFHLTEMPAMKAEKWAMRALFAVARSGVDIGEALDGTSGMQGIALVGMQALFRMDFVDAEPLLDEMLQCVTVKPDPNNPMLVRALFETDIEEVSTLLSIRDEVLRLHTGFSLADAASKSTSQTASA